MFAPLCLVSLFATTPLRRSHCPGGLTKTCLQRQRFPGSDDYDTVVFHDDDDDDDFDFLKDYAEEEEEAEETVVVKKSKKAVSHVSAPRRCALVVSRSEDLNELKELTRAAGMEVAETMVARIAGDASERAKTLVDSETLEKLKCMKADEDLVFVFDEELTATQQAFLEKELRDEEEEILSKKQKAMRRQALELQPTFDKFANKRQERKKEMRRSFQVMDRTAIVLEVFSKRARTHEGRLQTALAVTLYRMPRASMTRGLAVEEQLGSTKTERKLTADTDRKTLAKRASVLRKKIKEIQSHRSVNRRLRLKNKMPVVALVGYTNAGKSSLFEALVEDELTTNLIDDKPFATLDPLTRKIRLDSRQALVTDTVGFVSKLPASVSAAFRATLEEVKSADIIVHVLDASATPALLKKRANVVDTELEALFSNDEERPRLIFFYNKIDQVPNADSLRAKAKALKTKSTQEQKKGLVVGSCRTREGIDDLRSAIAEALDTRLLPIDIFVPHSSETQWAQAALSDLRDRGQVDFEVADFKGTHIKAKAPFDLQAKLSSFSTS